MNGQQNNFAEMQESKYKTFGITSLFLEFNEFSSF